MLAGFRPARLRNRATTGHDAWQSIASTMTEPTELPEITDLLQRWREGGKAAEDALVERIYPLLRRLAAARLRGRGPITWQPTDLVGEAYAKLFVDQRAHYQDRHHFLAIAARVMRRVLADHYRERHAQKRGGELDTISLDDADARVDAPAAAPLLVDLIEVDRLLDELAGIDPRGAQIVEMRYFGGLSVPEVGAAMDLSERTVKRSWQFARAWLHQRLEPGA